MSNPEDAPKTVECQQCGSTAQRQASGPTGRDGSATTAVHYRCSGCPAGGALVIRPADDRRERGPVFRASHGQSSLVADGGTDLSRLQQRVNGHDSALAVIEKTYETYQAWARDDESPYQEFADRLIDYHDEQTRLLADGGTTSDTESMTTEHDQTDSQPADSTTMTSTCDSIDCDSTDDVTTVRDPEGNTLEMCADCRSEWPVTVVDNQARADGGQTEHPTPADEEGTPASVPTKEPDAQLRLTDDGLEMPDFLRGYIGEFTMRTPNITDELETSDGGLPDTEFWDGILAEYPSEGDYHGDLREGLMALSTPGHRETVYEIVDERTDEVDA